MKNNTFLPVSATRRFTSPALDRDYGKGAVLTVTASAYQLSGNSHPHFSVTGDVSTAASRRRNDSVAGGCLHEEAARYWPAISPVIALHLANADNGVPMHAEANGFYWLAGMVGGLGEQYHGGSGSDGKTRERCTEILADHLRISTTEASDLAAKVEAAYNAPIPEGEPRTSKDLARAVFVQYVESCRARWQTEAEAGIALIARLASQ